MSKLCPKCGCKPHVLNEQQVGVIRFYFDDKGKVHENGLIDPTDANGVYGECESCGHEWKIDGITHAYQYDELT